MFSKLLQHPFGVDFILSNFTKQILKSLSNLILVFYLFMMLVGFENFLIFGFYANMYEKEVAISMVS